MTSEDLVLVGALAAVSMSVAYLLGRRGGAAGASQASSSQPSTTKAAEAALPTGGAEAALPTGTPPVAASSPTGTPEKSPAPPASTNPTKAPDVARLDYEEDDNVDPTRIGTNAASAAAARAVYQPPIKRIPYDEEADNDEPTLSQSFFLVHARAQTDTGLRRKRNEDSLLVFEEEHLFVIADGMGGYQGGQLASQTAVKTVAAAYKTQTFEGPPHEGVPADATNLARAIQMGNAAILGLAQRKAELEGMGTTICAARFSPNKKRMFIGHVGDSRCYRLRDGALKQITADHTMADFGVTGPESSQLSRAVGIWPTVPIDIITVVPAPGDVYLLCSDGLTKMLPDETIGVVLREEEEPQVAVERLILFANARGGKDNITVILIRVVPPNWKQTGDAKTSEGAGSMTSVGS
jgi:PPM family protein phosphatase